MKAVVYHTNASIAKQFPDKTYELLFRGLKKNLNSFGISLVHLSIKGFPGWGDENYFFDGDPEDIVYNREKFFIEFLKNCDGTETYWFTEPDSRLITMFPPLTTDLALLYRNRAPNITPSWRLATKQALPIFEEIFSYYDLEKKTWHGDSTAYQQIWEIMNCPKIEIINYKNISIELRNYKEYSMTKSKYTQQYKFHHKEELLFKEAECIK